MIFYVKNINLLDVIKIALGIYMAIYVFGIRPLKNPTSPILKHKIFFKFSAILFIASGLWGLSDFFRNPNDYKWTKKDKEDIIKNCKAVLTKEYEQHPNQVDEYCNCSAHNIITGMSKRKYKRTLLYGFEEQKKQQMPYIYNCLLNYKKNTSR